MTGAGNPDDATLASIEAVAIELARLGGAEIRAAMGTLLSVSYKGGDGGPQLLKDPVSEVDRRVEELIRARLAETFPEHDIIGEEMDERPGRGHDWVWAVDPIDGTANFVNGFPLFASSVGVLFRGRPVVGALWCSSGHTLNPGIYHAHRGSPLRFEGAEVARTANPAIRRSLAGTPDGVTGEGPWDARKTGSAAIECAFVAARLLQVSVFATPNIWDIAGGIALVEAAGGSIWQRIDGSWSESAVLAKGDLDPKDWRGPLIVGERSAAETMVSQLGD
jgi:myo-inositol-1(or 4)-monophosphatase